MSRCDECIKPEVSILKKLVFAMLAVGASLIYLIFDGAQIVSGYQRQVNEFRQEVSIHVAEDKLRFSNMKEAQLEMKTGLKDMTEAYHQQREAFNKLSSKMDLLLDKEKDLEKEKKRGN